MTDPTLESIARAQDRTILIVEQLVEKFEDRIEHTDAWRDKTDRMLYGDGNGFRGYNVRMDRLEVTAERSKWLVRTLGFGLLLMVLEMLLH